MQEHLCSHREGQFHFPTACTLSLILMTSLSSLPQLLAILDNLVEVSDLTDEERLWVYDKFASRTGKGPTRRRETSRRREASRRLLISKTPASRRIDARREVQCLSLVTTDIDI